MNFEKSKSPTPSSSGEMDKSQDSESDEEIVPPPKSKKKAEPKGKKTPEKKSYRCDRCNFSSSSKAKYTKHAKSAHSGTIVQCDHCEFKTPYKWNLDRHYKNHLGGGALCCHLCNFSCDIKQSLTVHLQNHHSNVPEEIIESVKRQQIPPRNQSINRKANANPVETTNPKPASPIPTVTKVEPPRSESPEVSSDGEKKVPPLRISRALTGLSLGEENNSGDESPPSSNAAGGGGSAMLEDEKKRDVRKCDLCDFETCGDGSGSGSSVLKKHMASTHGVHRKHHHKEHKRERGSSSSPEHGLRASSPPTNISSSPSIPVVVPIPLPPKKSKGTTSPRPGQSASSTNNSPAIHRSQSPMKASEAINAFGNGSEHPPHHGNLQAAGPSEAEHHPQSILNLAQATTLPSVGEESAFTPVVSGGDFTHAQLSSLKKPKQRALAQFYQKIKPKFTTATEQDEGSASIHPLESSALGGDFLTKEEPNDDTTKNGSSAPSSKSNRCQHCRQRCKSSADLATHLEKCMEATKKEGAELGESQEQTKPVKEENALLPIKPTTKAISQWNGSGKDGGVEEMDDGEYESKPKSLNSSSSGDPNDDLIGFETAPGVGAIHTGKMEEMEYQGYSKDEIGSPGEEGESSENQVIPELDDELDDEMEEEGILDAKKTGKGGKAQVTNRKVYRCPESDCSFWATTASRFHVHIVGHYNLKPFECSECHYKSNWRWDVNKHIRLKTPKDPKHAVAKTLLTHESGQRDYRKYDNYLVTMSLLHSANAKAPDCSTVATKRTKTPKSSPELTATPKHSPTGSSCSSSISTGHTPISPPERKSKSKKAQALLSASLPPTSASGGSSPFLQHPSNLSQHQQPQHEDLAAYPLDMASSSSPSEGRSFVETRMLAGGEIYQTSLLKQDPSVVGEREQEEGGDIPPSGFDLTLKRPRSRHPHQEEEMRKGEMGSSSHPDNMQGHSIMMPVIPTKKSRLQQHHHQQQEEQRQHIPASASGGATMENGNKILSMWQCIKCNFKHSHKDVVNSHIRDQHKPKKGDPVSLLSHNHLIQVVVPEQDADALMASSTSMEATDFSMNGGSQLKKELFQPVYIENGKVLSCKFCPFTTGLLYEMEIHAEHHLNQSNSYYSCPHCSYSVAVKSELHEHLKLHGEMSPQQLEIQNRLINSSIDSSRLSLLSPTSTMENLSMGKQKDSKKGHCLECPYFTNDLSEFQYHRQCHEPNNYPFKCHKCTFNVSVKLHLLQHLQVHGIQIDEAGVPPLPPVPDYTQYAHHSLNTEYESISDDGYSPNGTQEEPLNLSIFANRKPVIVYDTNGVPIEGYKCSVCPQIFQDLNDLKEHEFVNNHRSTRESSTNASNSGNFPNSRQCESPPMEAMNLSVKLSDHGNSSKKSSQNSSKVNSGSGKRSRQQTQTSVPMSISSPSSLSSVDTSISSAPTGSSKAEKEYIYLCDSCPARFFFEKELKIHHTFHENKSTFQCPKCTYSARQKDPHLMSHMRVHGATYQEKTKALLTKFPRGKVTPSSSSSSSSSAAAAAYQAAAAAALSAASLLNLNSSLLNSNFNFQTAAAALSSAAGKNAIANVASAFVSDPSGLEGLRKNGLSMVCPKCPEKFYNPQAFQQHLEQHSNGRGGTEYRCRFCDYWAESRKAITVHEIVHTGTDNMSLEPAVAKLLSSSSLASAFNPVSMMAIVGHQDSPFTSPANPPALIGGNHSGDQEGSDKNTGPVPDEAYEGNPEFVYPTYMKNGRVKSKRYKCMKCPSAFEKKDQYHTHTGLHGSNQKYKCTVCDYAVTYYANYIQHLKKHENQRNIPTDLLNLGRKRHQDEDGNSSSLLKISKLSENGENSSSSSISANSNGSSFDSNSENHHHHHHPHNGGLMKCSYCPFHCFDESTLDGHVIHHQENPNWLHVCNVCTFRTSSKKSLKEHSRLHLLNGFSHRIHPYQQLAPQPQKLPEIKNGGLNLGMNMTMTSGLGGTSLNDKQKNGDMGKGEYLNGYNGRDDIEDVSSDGSV